MLHAGWVDSDKDNTLERTGLSALQSADRVPSGAKDRLRDSSSWALSIAYPCMNCYAKLKVRQQNGE